MHQGRALDGKAAMAIPQNKVELLAAINTNFDKLLADLKTTPESAVLALTMAGHAQGTMMSPANLVAYLLGWNELVLKWIDRDSKGQPIDFPEIGFKWNELGRLAQKFYRDYETLSWQDLLQRLEKAKREIATFIETCDNARLYERAWYKEWTLGRMIQFNTASPYANARARLRKWKKASGY